MGMPREARYTLGMGRNEQQIQGHCLKGLGGGKGASLVPEGHISPFSEPQLLGSRPFCRWSPRLLLCQPINHQQTQIEQKALNEA